MTDKLAFKHKNSLALRENNVLNKKCKSKNCTKHSRLVNYIFLPIITCIIFIGYWFILCPLLWAMYHTSAVLKHWHFLWTFLFWIVALLIWIFITIILYFVWKRLKSRCNVEIKMKSYGTEDPAQVTNTFLEKEKLYTARQTKQTVKMDIKNESESFLDKKCRDLPALSIHKRMSGDSIENTGTVDIDDGKNRDTGDNETLLSAEDGKNDNIDRQSMREYLKLVTITPTEEAESTSKSPKTPMSPRDLFFIDLIRQAEKAESTTGSKRSSRFFPDSPVTPPPQIIGKTDITSNEQNNPEKCAEANSEDSKKESCGTSQADIKSKNEQQIEANYFIADVESPTHEKTEVFLEINPDEGNTDKDNEQPRQWLVDLNREKPMLTLESTSEEFKGN